MPFRLHGSDHLFCSSSNVIGIEGFVKFYMRYEKFVKALTFGQDLQGFDSKMK